MAASKRLTPEQIVARLRDAEKMQGQGATIPQVCKKLGVSEQTFYRWRSKYGALKEDEAIRLKTLEQENRPPEADRCRAGVGHLDAQGCRAGKLEPGPSAGCGGDADA
ncbi:MAG: transposase [Tetrasphaera sp.]|nr:transposase [Tetrasphaera sp.]